MSSNPTVFVTGATGYIAQHIVIDLLKRNYKVIGTVRSKPKGDSLLSNIKSNYPQISTNIDSNFSYEIVPDISKPGAFDQALKNNQNIQVFIHTASPFTFNIKDIKSELLDPAIEGTKNALIAVLKYGPEIKRVVITSSIAAIQSFGKHAKLDGSDVFDESCWNPISYQESTESAFNGYLGSKKFAEKSAWEFVQSNNPNFTLSVINPGMVFGPQAFPIMNKKELNTSSEVINKLLKLKPGDKVPDDGGVFIDVRDVAHAHIVAFEKDEAQGKRLILVNGPYNDQAIVNIIREDFKTLDLILPEGDPEKGKVAEVSPRWNNTKTREILGFKFITLEKSVHDSVQQIIGDAL